MKRIKVNDISDFFPISQSFLNELNTINEGKYWVNKDVFCNVETYVTTDKESKRYESHKHYIDVQLVIAGCEIISVRNVDGLTICETYDCNRDISFYLGDNDGEDVLLESGDAIILGPEDGHMDGIYAYGKRNDYVKKAVFKIPYQPQKNIKLFIMDVDGTLTDGKIYMSSSGEAMKAFNIKDGCGIHDILIPANIIPVIITGRKSQIIENRAKELGINEIHQGITDKLGKLKKITSDLSTVAYIGDDVNDLVCMEAVKEAGGVIGCPADAVEEVRHIADFVAVHNGGDGSVRDFIEWIVER